MWVGMFGAAVGAGIACLCRSEYERKQLVVERFTVHSKKITEPRTVVFLADLHDNEFGRGNETLLREIETIAPDAVLIGGDMMVCKGKGQTHIPLNLIKKLAAQYQVYYGNGNHENRMNQERQVYGDLYDNYQRELLQCGVIPLHDGCGDLGGNIMLYGMDIDEPYYEKRYKKGMKVEYIDGKLGSPDRNRYHILLAHSPLFFKAYSDWGADLTLAGHFHGGTIRIPILGGVMTPQFHFFLPWCSGIFEENGRKMIVSRGLGTHSINIRLNNKPQLIVVELSG